MEYKNIDLENKDGTAWVYINRPEQRNSLNKATLLELIDAFKSINEDTTTKVAVLTGRGKVFVGGADLKELVSMDAIDYLEYGNLYNTLNKMIRENEKPVICAVNGHALGGGNVLVLSTDIIVAADNAKLAVPEINLGIFGGASILPSIIGRYRAAELVLMGEAYTAQRAYEMGLVNRVVPADELINVVNEIAEKIKDKSSLAVRMAKKALNIGNRYDVNTASDFQLPIMSLLYSGHDQKEGMQAFFEKRPPVYIGR